MLDIIILKQLFKNKYNLSQMNKNKKNNFCFFNLKAFNFKKKNKKNKCYQIKVNLNEKFI